MNPPRYKKPAPNMPFLSKIDLIASCRNFCYGAARLVDFDQKSSCLTSDSYIAAGSTKKLNQDGLTIVELMISIGIATALVTVLFSVSLGFFGSAIRSQVTAQMAIDSHFMLRAVIEDLRLAHSIGSTNILTDANAPSGGWITGDTHNVLIINRPATTPSNDIIYNDDTGNPYNHEHIYYLSDNTLFKRLLKNNDAIGSTVTTSCPHTISSSTCPADRKYASYVEDITLTFYDNNNNETTNMQSARSVKFGITTSRRVFGQTLTFNNSTFTKLRN